MEIGVLGSLVVLHGGKPIELGPRKQRLVLSALLTAPDLRRGVDQLVCDLWPDEPPARPKASVYSYVSRLRRALAVEGGTAPIIDLRGDTYVLAIDPSIVDANRFAVELDAVRSGAGTPAHRLALLDQALARWRGEPYADADGEPFARAAIDRLLALRCEAEELHVELLGATGQGARAVAAARAMLGRDPLDEHTHGVVMLALYRAGRQSEALRHFQAARELLVEEVGVEPSAELRRLEQRILDQDPSLTPAPVPHPSTDPIDLLPVEQVGGGDRPRTAPASASPGRLLVGRRRELAALEQLGLSDGPPATAVVAGEPGIGKTRLLREVAARARARGDEVIWVRCERGPRGTGLLPVVTAVADLAQRLEPRQLRQLTGADARLLAPVFAPATADADRDGSVDISDDLTRYRIELAVRRSLRRLSDRSPVIVVVDDAQWASPLLLDLVVALATTEEPLPVTFLVATRTAQPDEVGRVLQVLYRSSRTLALDLGGLDEDAVAELVIATVDSAGAELAAELSRRTAGNPLFMTELLRGIDTDDPGTSLERFPAPASVAEAVLRHLDDLEPAGRELLDVASLFGPVFDPVVCAEIARPGHDAVGLIDEVIRAGLVVEDEGGHAFRHDLVRSAITARMNRARQAEIHARIGRALDARFAKGALVEPWRGGGAAPYERGLLAHHLCAGAPFGTGLDGARHASAAAQQALDTHDAAEAVRLVDQGLEALHHVVIESPGAAAEVAAVQARLLCDRAEGLQRLFRHLETHDAARAAFEVALANQQVAVATRAIRIFYGQNTGAWLGFWSHSDDAVEMAGRLIRAAGGIEALAPATAVQLIGPLSEALLDLGQIDRADELTATALRIGTEVGDPAMRAFAAQRRLVLVDLRPDTGERDELCATMLAAQRLHAHYAPSARRHLMVGHLERGDLAAAEHEIRRIEQLARRTGSDLVAFQGAYCRSAVDLLVGRLDDAQRRIDSARQRFAHFDATRLDVLNIQQFSLLWDRGLLALAEDEIRRRLVNHSTHSWKAALVAVLIEGDRRHEARQLLASMSPAEFQRVFEAALQFLTPTILADAVADLGDEERALWLLGLLEPVRHRLVSFYGGSLLLGWASLPVGRLQGLVGRHDEADTNLAHAEAMAQKLGSSSFALRARIARAELAVRRGCCPREPLDTLAGEATTAGYDGIARFARRVDAGR